MRPADALELFTLAAVWGSSFIFMRLGAAEFGALPRRWSARWWPGSGCTTG
jgi:hypothetical protein